MKRAFVIGMALAFTLGIAGLGFPADQGTMKHDDVKICGNINCCGNLKKEAAPVTKKSDESEKKLPVQPVNQFGGG